MSATTIKTTPLKICDTTLRDGHQSLFATRMRTSDMIAIAERLDEMGFAALEVWGGATFDVMHRFLGENPFDRLRELKKVAPKTPFQMLLRGQNLVGYRNYHDDVVDAFVKHSAEVGVDVFRVFDALNDPRNLEAAAKAIKTTGKHFQAAISFSLTERKIGGEVFNEQYYKDKARQFLDLGADSICIKDMAGMISPDDAHKLVTLLKEITEVPIQLHTHLTSGMGVASYLKAAEAGVDIVDCALAPLGHRSSQPPAESIVVALEGTERDTGIALPKIVEIDEMLEGIIPRYRDFMDTSRQAQIDVGVLLHQIPGGMQSNMTNQLRQAGALDRLHEVHEELPRTRRELGNPPLVTPTSQIVGTQAVMNVLTGRYKMISSEVKALCYGLYGKTPTAIDPEILKICLKGYERGEQPIEGRAADYLEPEMEQAIAKTTEIYREAGNENKPSDDDVLIMAIYPRTGETYLKWKLGTLTECPAESCKTVDDIKREDELVKKALTGQLSDAPKAAIGPNSKAFKISVNGEVFELEVDTDSVGAAAPVGQIAVQQTRKSINSRPSSMPPKSAAPATKALSVEENQLAVTAPMPGTLIEYLVKKGDIVTENQALLTLEAMKMQNQVTAPINGLVVKLGPAPGNGVMRDEVLLVLEAQE